MNNYKVATSTPTLMTVLQSTQNDLLYNKLNCMRIGIVESFDAETMTVKTNIANKRQIGLNQDGTPILQDYPPIYAKVCYASTGMTCPIVKGTEGILLFNDREIESWFINGGINSLAYNRSHSYSDAIFICGVRSLPNVLTAVASDCVHLFYGNSNIKIKSNSIELNGSVNVSTGASGTFTTKDNKTITVANGIITGIN